MDFSSPVSSSNAAASNSKYTMRERQKEILVDMIRSAVPCDSFASGGRANQSSPNSATAGLTNWKVLLYDLKGRDIIAPLLKVKELHDLGVTLPLLMKKERTAVSNTPAVYLCEPTEENIALIAKDCAKELYQWVYINFISQCPRQQMESLAEQLAASGTLSSIRHIRVFDQTLSFVAETNDLYSLMLKKSFVTLNSRLTADVDMEAHVDQITLGISHVLLSQQVLPIIAHSRSGPSEMIGQRLSGLLGDLIRENLISTTASAVAGRPLLLVVDRSSDLAAGLHHPFSYRGLLVDALGMHLNKVKATTEQGPKTLDIDPLSDTVYSQFGGHDFGDFSQHVQRALEVFRREYAAISGVGGGGGDPMGSDKNAITEMLANAPKLRDQKLSLDAHMTLAHNVLSSIQQLNLDKYHGVEAGVLFSEGFDVQAFAELMGSSTPLADKQRIFLVAYIVNTSDESKLQELEKFRHYVEGEGKPFPALQHIKNLKSWSAASHRQSNNEQQNAASFGWSLAQNLAKNITSTFTQGGKRQLNLTRMVDALLQDNVGGGGGGRGVGSGGANSARGKLIESLGAIEPRTGRPVDLLELKFNQIIIFVVGGGSINEYDNLKQWEQEHPRKSIIYGSTDMLSGSELLEQLGVLGSE